MAQINSCKRNDGQFVTRLRTRSHRTRLLASSSTPGSSGHNSAIFYERQCAAEEVRPQTADNSWWIWVVFGEESEQRNPDYIHIQTVQHELVKCLFSTAEWGGRLLWDCVFQSINCTRLNNDPFASRLSPKEIRQGKHDAVAQRAFLYDDAQAIVNRGVSVCNLLQAKPAS